MSTLTAAPGVIAAAGRHYVDVIEAMKYLDCKQSKAYELIRSLRNELIESGRLTPEYPSGKVPRKYFFERCMIEEQEV